MTRSNTVLIVFSIVLMALLSATHVRADYFNQYSGHNINQDFNSGFAYGGYNGTNAIVTDISSSMLYNMEEESGNVYIDATFILAGIWASMGDGNEAYYNFMVDRGLDSVAQFDLTRVTVSGDEYEFANPVSLHMGGHAGLWRDDESSSDMQGFAYVNTNGQGTIPIMSASTYSINENDFPGGVDRWSVSIHSTWLVTEPLTLVPAPGSATLLGLGGLVATRRRRR